MKHKLLLLALAFTSLAPLTSRAESEVSFEFFYDNLSPYGEWIEVGDYGTCWRPRDVDDEWSPYTDGYWSYTDAGWTWVSYEDFGDITYHYGRWVRVNDFGWCWVPDYEWGPAWVSWRKTDDYVGWAPLPPEARWRSSVGFSVWVDDHYDIGPSYYNFCPVVDFGAPVIRSVCVSRSRAFGIFGLSVNITNISYNSYNRHVFCGGPDYGYIHRYSRRPVPTLKLVHNTTIINNNVTIVNNQRVVRPIRNSVQGNTLQVFAPKVVNKGPSAGIRPPKITKVIPKTQVDKGWAMVKDPVEVKKMRDKMKTDTKGLTPDTAPARPVAITDLKPLPEKADTNAPSPVQIAPRPGRPGKGKTGKDNAVVVQPPVAKPDTKLPPSITKPSVLPTEKPATVETKPARPAVMPTEKPGKKPGKESRPAIVTQPDVPATRPAVTKQNPITKPFRETNTPPATVETRPATQPMGKKSKQSDDGAERIARQQQEAASAQRRMAEQAERQRAAEANAARMRQSQADALRKQSQSQRPPQPKPDYSAQRQQQAEAAQRQAAMQRQAEAQQRAAQAQRQETLQRQMQSQRQQQQAQPRQAPQSRPQYQPMQKPQTQQRQQVPSSKGTSRGGTLTPEQLEALKKKSR